MRDLLPDRGACRVSCKEGGDVLSVRSADYHGRDQKFTSNDGAYVEVVFVSCFAECIHVHTAGDVARECVGTSRIKE
jgi:hypothetical protein